MSGLDKLNLGLSWFIRYVVTGAVLAFVVAYLADPEGTVIKAIPDKVFSSEILVTLALFVIGAPAYHFHHEVAIRAHHLLLCSVFRIWEALWRVDARDSWNPVRLLGSPRFFEVKLFRRFAAYSALRREKDVFPDSERLYVLHAVYGVPVLAAEAFLALFIGKWIQTAPAQPSYGLLLVSVACLVISLVPPYRLHRREGARMKAVGAAVAIRRTLAAHGFCKKQTWEVALDEFVQKIRNTYDGQYGKTFLYGSRARGTADDDSDVDVLVVLNLLRDFWKESSTMQDLAEPICLEHDVMLSALPVDKNEFDKPHSPLLLNAQREGYTWDER